MATITEEVEVFSLPDVARILGMRNSGALMRYLRDGELQTIRVADVHLVTLPALLDFIQTQNDKPGNKGSRKVKNWVKDSEQKARPTALLRNDVMLEFQRRSLEGEK